MTTKSVFAIRRPYQCGLSGKGDQCAWNASFLFCEHQNKLKPHNQTPLSGTALASRTVHVDTRQTRIEYDLVVPKNKNLSTEDLNDTVKRMQRRISKSDMPTLHLETSPLLAIIRKRTSDLNSVSSAIAHSHLGEVKFILFIFCVGSIARLRRSRTIGKAFTRMLVVAKDAIPRAFLTSMARSRLWCSLDGSRVIIGPVVHATGLCWMNSLRLLWIMISRWLAWTAGRCVGSW